MDDFIKYLVAEISDAFVAGQGRVFLVHDDEKNQVRFGFTKGEVRRALKDVRKTRPHAALMGVVQGVNRSLKDTLVEYCTDDPNATWLDYDEVFVEIAQVFNAFGRIKFPALRDADFRRGFTIISCPPTKAQLDYICATVKYESMPYVEYRTYASIEEQGDPTGRIPDHPPSSTTVRGQIYRRCLHSPGGIPDFAEFTSSKSTLRNSLRALCDQGWLHYDGDYYNAVAFQERQQQLATQPAPAPAPTTESPLHAE